jgi:predicted RNase H-like nuclease (RuvC/YqgF family)
MTLREIRERAMQLMHTEITRLENEIEREQREQDLLQEKIFQLSDSMARTGPITTKLHEIEQYQRELSHTLDRTKTIDAHLARARRRLELMVRRAGFED